MLQTLESSWVADYIRDSSLLYPLIEVIHILGFIILVGAAFMFDLRLLGVSKILPVKDLGKHLLPWSQRSLLLVVPSGLLLFIANATAYGDNPVFILKLILIICAFLNAGIFHLFVYKKIGNQSQLFYSKFSALLSILLWIGVLTCGRLLAYF